MQNGKPLPYISAEGVKEALDALLHPGARRRPNALTLLMLVDEYLSNPDLPPAENRREFALNHILTDLVTQEYNSSRVVFDLSPVSSKAPLAGVVLDIAADLRTGASILMGWSWVYHRYVRVDLSLQPAEFSEYLHVDVRTLRRYQQDTILLITDRLTGMEAAARRRNRKRRLYAELPATTPLVLYGRSHDLNHIERYLHEQPRKHVLITGAAGTGKTALIQEAIRRQIDAGSVENLIWLTAPPSADYIRQYLWERFLPEGSVNLTLRELLLLHQPGVVLDEVEHLWREPDEFHDLLDYLSPVVLVMTSRRYAPLESPLLHLTLHDISRLDAEKVITNRQRQQSMESSLEAYDVIWESAGGNLLALNLLAANFPYFERQARSPFDPRSFYTDTMHKLDDDQRRTWFRFALLPPGEVSCGEMENAWNEANLKTDTIRLLERNMIEVTDALRDRYMLTTIARNCIQHYYQQDAAARVVIDQLLEQISPDFSPPDVVFRLVEYVLCCDWLDISPQWRDGWITTLCRRGLPRGAAAKWRDILSRYLANSGRTDDYIAAAAYGVCLRRLAEWDAALAVFQHVIAEAGRAGHFQEQSRAVLEMAILHRYRGMYQAALAALEHAEKTAARYQDEPLLHAVCLEKAQIAVDSGDWKQAQLCLTGLPHSPRMLLLWGETHLLQGDFESCRYYAEQALEQAGEDRGLQGRIYTLIGSSYHRETRTELARQYLTLAVTCMEQEEDYFALARSKLNLGALLISIAERQEARALLNHAQHIQERLSDRAALEATRHNLALLDRLDSG